MTTMLGASTGATSLIVLLALAVVGLGGLAARTWIVSKIQEAAKEDVRWTAIRREKAAAVAAFLATWVEPNYRSTPVTDEDRSTIQKAYWELALWLDAPTLRKLNEALSGNGDPFAALASARAVLVDDDDPVTAAEFVRWLPADRKPGGIIVPTRVRDDGDA